MKKRVYRDWPEVTVAWRASGKSKNDFCQEMGINRNLFDKNLRGVSPKKGAAANFPVAQQASCPTESATELTDAVVGNNRFLEVIAAKTELARVIRITTASGCVVEVPL